MEFETIIGLEVHVQLNTKTKIFCPCPTSFGAEPNTNVCPVCLGLPGTLPVLNKSAVIKAISLATAIKATVNRCSIFARKSYFYPDLPKSYQISQFESPIISDGSIEIECDGHTKTIRVARAHLEEDAGKSIHEGNISKIDFNRAGMPLIEIVSSPDIRSGKEAVSYLKKLHSIVRFLDISDANMQEGSFRCDANVSVRPVGDSNLYRRVEIKNLNSFRFIQKAIEYEVDRQTQAWEDGRYEDEVVQETRLFDTHKGMTKSMRGKEESADYRYFPDPDLPPLRIDDALMELGQRIPEMPDEKVKRYTEKLGLKSSDAIAITRELDTTRFFEGLIEDGVNPKSAFTWLMVELLGRLKGENTISSCGIGHKMLSELIHKVNDGEISAKAAKDILDHIVERRGGDVDSLIAELGLAQVNDEKVIMDSIKEVLRVHKDKADEFRSGKEKILGFLVGQVMKHNKGMNPARVSAILKEELGRP